LPSFKIQTNILIYFSTSAFLVYAENPVLVFLGGDVLAYLVQEIEEKGTERLWSLESKKKTNGGVLELGYRSKKKLFLSGFGVPKTTKFSHCECEEELQ
jgi:hypothetical protein